MSEDKRTFLPVEATRVDRDHWPAHMDEHPELFVASVREFLASRPAEQWDCRISQWAYGIVRLTAIAKTDGGKP